MTDCRICGFELGESEGMGSTPQVCDACAFDLEQEAAERETEDDTGGYERADAEDEGRVDRFAIRRQGLFASREDDLQIRSDIEPRRHGEVVEQLDGLIVADRQQDRCEVADG